MRKPAYVLALASTLTLGGCLDGWLTTTPQNILTDEQLWTDEQLIVNVLADYYDRLPIREGPHGGGETGTWAAWTNYDEAILSRQDQGSVAGGGVGSPGNYSYALIRDIHVAMAGIQAVPDAELAGLKSRFLAELRFLRAYIYFDMVKRHGGVPLITERLVYTGNVEELQVPRAAEAEIYDFIYNEMMAVRDDLPKQPTQKTRATWGTATALISRSQLYAGSIAYHNNNSPDLDQPLVVIDPNTNKMVAGIPESEANKFYQRALVASEELIDPSSGYALLTGPDPSQAFHNIFVTKANNTEVIFVKDYGGPKNHWFAMRGRPQSMKVDAFGNWQGSEIGATLNVVENFDYLDSTRGPLPGAGDGTPAGQANWIFYDSPGEILAGRDGRLYGTVLGPGGTLGSQGSPVVQTGVCAWSQAQSQYNCTVGGGPGSVYAPDPSFGIQVGGDGTAPNTAYFNNTGFWIKKYLNPDPSKARYAPGDDTWVVYMRLGEIYMNATEAAFQLGDVPRALQHINDLRVRAGFPPNSLTSLTMEKIQQERWAELAYEDHRLWDLRRWRIAHVVWDGVASNPTTRLWVLSAYRVYHPTDPTRHGKWVFNRHPHVANANGRNFGIGNYYSGLPQAALDNNPLLVQNSGF